MISRATASTPQANPAAIQAVMQNPNEAPERQLAAAIQAHRLLAQRLGRIIQGEPDAIRLSLIAAYTASHALVLGGPAVGKSTLIKALAGAFSVVGLQLQGYNDAIASDLTGNDIPDVARHDWWHAEGPLERTCFLIADEINRYSSGALSALLTAMQEGKIVTAGGNVRLLPQPFVVLSALNPQDRGTTPLSAANDDRFGVAFTMGPQLVTRRLGDSNTVRLEGGLSEDELALRIAQGSPVKWRQEAASYAEHPLFAGDDLLAMQRIIADHVYVQPELDRSIARIHTVTCEGSGVVIGYRAPEVHRAASQANALTQGRDFVTDDDVVATYAAVYRQRLHDPTYTQRIEQVQARLFTDQNRANLFTLAATQRGMRDRDRDRDRDGRRASATPRL